VKEKAASWLSGERFLNETLSTSIAATQPDLLTGSTVDFEAVTEVVADVDKKYASFIKGMCHGLKWALLAKEDRTQGRVKLADFYRIGRDGDWRLTEKAGYLREIGTLDENGEAPRVIVPNYLGALTNCHHVSPFYSLCCQNECNELMEHIEKELGEATAAPGRIVEVVRTLGSDSVRAPRELPTKLVQRLDDATHDAAGGRVPIHGRLFAQWMHHAFPNECSYPHELGSWSYRHPEDWSDAQGLTGVAATEEEMDEYCKVDSSSWKEGDPEVEREIPWSNQEELLIQLGPNQVSGRFQRSRVLPVMVLGVVGLIVALGRSQAVNVLRTTQRQGVLV